MIASVLMLSTVTACNAQIVALGASSTAGYGVGAASSFPAQLERILRARVLPM
jgi:acyl-CoA thioesterase-1